MEFISINEIGNFNANIWKSLPEIQEMIITDNGQPIALLTPLNAKTFEATIDSVRRAKAVSAVKLIQQQALRRNQNKMTMEDINKEIQSVRKEMNK
jgi:antitoxin (DNA-binding transcriptional repressor) of toxin-antitoxin stability system